MARVGKVERSWTLEVTFETLKEMIADQQIEIRLLREANAILGQRVAQAEAPAAPVPSAEPIPLNREQRRRNGKKGAASA